ncbi:hypothetical protein CEXT_361901 [Caerostris extrusa]|uniref:Uncharacterized protein n=1 Tax=Caerostris extrusa TaxID=172846 RepID=A0AAV4TYU2_CAEEX|nr:hypothetical protein CEXT_361901 [Caerostris extrusa]
MYACLTKNKYQFQVTIQSILAMTICSECRQALAKTIGKLQPYKRGVLAREEQYPYEIPELSIRTTMLLVAVGFILILLIVFLIVIVVYMQTA